MKVDFRNIPPEIARKLDESLSRVRGILRLRGLAMTIATLVASILVIMAIDAMVTIFSSVVRWGLWLAGAVTTASVAWISLIKPLRRKFTAAEIASLIERNHPELEERLSTVVELAQSGDLNSSKQLLESITVAAVKDAGKVDSKKEFTSRTVKPRLFAALAALAVLGGLFAMFPTATLRLVTRAIVPSAEIDNVYASALKVSPGDMVLLEGSSLTVNLAVEGGFPSKAYVRTKIEGRSESVERMLPSGADEQEKGRAFYSFNYPSLSESFTYRMHCGAAVTRSYNVRVVKEPSYSDRVITITHPEYTGRKSDSYTNTADIVALKGSKVHVSVIPSSKDVEGELLLPLGKIIKAESKKGRLEASFDMDVQTDGSWGIVVWDENGFSNKVQTASIRTVKDTPPAVKVLIPEEKEFKLAKTGIIPINYEITDDFGLKDVTLEMCLGAGAWDTDCTLSYDSMGDFKWSGMDTINLSSRELNNSGVVRFRIKAEDNLPVDIGGPHVAYSEEITVTVVGKNTSLASQSLSSEISEAKKDAENILKSLKTFRQGTDSCSKKFLHTSNSWQLQDAKKTLEWTKAAAINAEQLLMEFIAGLEEGRLESGAELFRKVLKDHVVPCREQIEDVYLVAREADKAESCKKLVPEIDIAIKEFEKAQRRFDALSKTAEDLQKLADFVAREESLVEMAEKGEMNPEEFLEQQKQLEEDFKEEFKEELSKEDRLKEEKEKVEKLKERSEELEKRQEELEKKLAEVEKNGDENARNELAKEEKKLASDMKELAEDTEKLANKIDEEAGTVDTPENRTAEPVEDAAENQKEASESAKDASKDISEGEWDKAKEEMQNAQQALEQAQQDLAKAQESLDAASKAQEEMAGEFQEMADKLSEATEAAEAAAKEWSEAQSEMQQAESQQGESQEGEQQQGESQEGDDQQGESQEGEQQQGEQQQGEQQQGESQEGEQQQGESQESDDQQGESPEGEQQQGEQQQGEFQQGEQQ